MEIDNAKAIKKKRKERLNKKAGVEYEKEIK